MYWWCTKGVFLICLSLLSGSIYSKEIELTLDDVAMMMHSRNANMAVPSKRLDSECIEALNFLGKQNKSKYNEYVQRYHKLANEYQFLNDNIELMKGEAEEVYTKALNVKTDMLCSNVKLEVFSYMRGRVVE